MRTGSQAGIPKREGCSDARLPWELNAGRLLACPGAEFLLVTSVPSLPSSKKQLMLFRNSPCSLAWYGRRPPVRCSPSQSWSCVGLTWLVTVRASWLITDQFYFTMNDEARFLTGLFKEGLDGRHCPGPSWEVATVQAVPRCFALVPGFSLEGRSERGSSPWERASAASVSLAVPKAERHVQPGDSVCQ